MSCINSSHLFLFKVFINETPVKDLSSVDINSSFLWVLNRLEHTYNVFFFCYIVKNPLPHCDAFYKLIFLCTVNYKGCIYMEFYFNVFFCLCNLFVIWSIIIFYFLLVQHILTIKQRWISDKMSQLWCFFWISWITITLLSIWPVLCIVEFAKQEDVENKFMNLIIKVNNIKRCIFL